MKGAILVVVAVIIGVALLRDDSSTSAQVSVGGVAWGVMLLVFCLSHATLFFERPAESNPVGGAAGWACHKRRSP